MRFDGAEVPYPALKMQDLHVLKRAFLPSVWKDDILNRQIDEIEFRLGIVCTILI